MAEISVGDIVAKLRLDATDFGRQLQDATRSLQQFGQQMQQGGSTGAQAMTAGLRQQTEGMRGLTEAMRQGTQAAQTFGDAWRTALQVAAGIGIATTINAVVNAIKNLATESVALAARMQDLHRAFTAIEGSAAAANRTITFLFDTANRLGVPVDTLVESFKRLEQASKGTALEGDGIRQAFVNISAGSRVLGVSSENLRGAFVALEQALSKGKFTAEEFRQQLAERLPGAAGMIAQGLGITTKALSDMVDLGIIPVESAIIALGNTMGQLRDKAQPGIAQLSETFAQLKNETTAWMTAFGQSIGTTLQPFLQDLLKISQTLREIFQIRPPGVQGAPGANQESFFSRFFPGLLAPTTLGTPAPGTTGPTEQPSGFAHSPFTAIIQREAERQGIDPIVFSRMIRQESGFNPTRPGPFVETAPGRLERAQGLGQILPSTAASEFGMTDIAALRQPETNLALSARLFREYRDRIRTAFGQLDDETRLTLAAYNAGIGRVMRELNALQRAGQPLTFGQLLPRLPERVQAQTGPYVQNIMAFVPPTGGAPGTTAGAPGTAAGAPGTTAPQDPFAPMLKTATEVIDKVATINKGMDAIAQSDLNKGGLLNEALGKQADEAIKKYTELATQLAAFPDLFAKMTPAQREAVEKAGQEVLLLGQRVALEAQTEGNARRRIQELAQAERLQEQINEQTIREAEHRRDIVEGLARKQQEAEQQTLQVLDTLIAKYGETKEARDADTLAAIMEKNASNEVIQAKVAEAIEVLRVREAYNEEVAALQDSFAAIKQRTDAIREAERTQEQFLNTLEDTVERLRTPRQEGFPFRTETVEQELQRVEARHQRRTGRELFVDEEGRQRAAALMEQQRQFERLNYVAERFTDVANGVGNAWTNALQNIATGTQTVGEAFRAMGQSILQTLTQMASQEAWRAFISLGLRLIFGAATGGLTGGMSTQYGAPIGPNLEGAAGAPALAGGGFNLGGLPAFQHGGYVSRPTLAMIGEGGPEYVIPQQRMASMMSQAVSRAPTAGGQAAGISIINVSSREEGERQRMQQEAMGRQVVVNYVLQELSTGESSRINRAIRGLQR